MMLLSKIQFISSTVAARKGHTKMDQIREVIRRKLEAGTDPELVESAYVCFAICYGSCV